MVIGFDEFGEPIYDQTNQLEYRLPALNNLDYIITIDQETVTYELIDKTYEVFSFELPLEKFISYNEALVREELINYYLNYTNELEVPSKYLELIDSYLENIEASEYTNKASIEAIILNGKIEIAKEIKYEVLDNLLGQYIEVVYTPANWQKIVGYVEAAKSNIDKLTNLTAIENYNIAEIGRASCRERV